MLITSWLAALQNKLFGKKLPTRTRLQQTKEANQATQAAEGLEQRTLMSVNALNDVYDTPGLNEDSFFTQDAAGGVLSNDPAGNGPPTAMQVGSDPAFLLRPDGSFDFDATALPVLQTLQHGQSQNYLFQYAVTDNDGVGAPAFVTLKVQGLNDATTAINTDQSHGYTEDQGSAVSLGAIEVSDVDVNDQITATLTLSDSAAGTLTAPNAVFNNGTLSVTGTVAEINSALASVTFTPAGDYDKDFYIAVSIADGLEDGAVPATGTITMTATPVPDNPTASDSSFTIDEDSGSYSGTLIGSDPDTNPLAMLTFSPGPNTATKGVMTITNSSTGAFTYTPFADVNGTDTFDFLVTDETTRVSGYHTVTVTINALNDAPSFDLPALPALLNQTVTEDSGAHSVPAFATNMLPGPGTAVDEAGQSLNFLVTVPLSDVGKFATAPAIDAVTGDLTYTLAANAAGDVLVTVILQDGGGIPGVNESAPQTFLIQITAVNDAPSFTLPALPDQTIAEDSGLQTVPGFATNILPGPVSASDEAGQTLNFIVTIPGADAAKFTTPPAISPSGVLTYQPAPDVYGDVTVTVALHDDGGMPGSDTSGTQTFVIHITALNDAPSFDLPALPDQTVVEDTGAHSVSAFATNIAPGPVTALDESGQQVNFLVTVAPADAAKFTVAPAINPLTGDLSYTLAPDAAGDVTVSMALHDDGGLPGSDTSGTQTFVIHITPVNDVPSFSLPGSPDQTVTEDSGPQTVSGFATNILPGPVAAIDESNQALDFIVTIAGADAAKFTTPPAISASGELTYETAPDAYGDVTVTVSLHDAGGMPGVDTSGTQTFIIHITALNDAPEFSLPASPDQSVAEDSGLQTVPGFATNILPGPATATDEALQSLDFLVTIPGADAGKFVTPPAISSTGVLTYETAPDAAGDVTVTVALHDNGGMPGSDTSATQTFVIHITPVNDVPSFSLPGSPDQTVTEDSGLQTISGFATNILPGPATAIDESNQTLDFIVTIAGADAAKFTTPPAISSTGVLTFETAPDVYGDVTVTVSLHDNAGTPGVDTSGTQTFVIHITALNDAPVFSLPASPDQTVAEDSGLQTVVDFATNILPGPATATDESGQDVDFIVTIPGADAAKFTTPPSINSSGVLTYQTAPDATGDVTVTVALHDNGGMPGADTSPTQTFVIHITAVNDAPSFNLPASPDQFIAEDAGLQTVPGFATNLASGPATATDEALEDLDFIVTVDGADAAKFSTHPSISPTGVLTYQLADNANGDITVTVKLHDNGGLPGADTSAPQTFVIHVAPVQDAPLATDDAVSTDEDQPVNIDVLFNDVDPDGDPLEIFVNAPSHGQVAISNNGTPGDFTDDLVQYTPDANFTGTDTFTYIVNDHLGGTSTATVTVTINPVNDAPAFTLGADQLALEDSGAHSISGFASGIVPGPVTATDEIGQDLTFVVTNDNHDLFLIQPAIAPDGTLTYTLAPNANGSATVSVKLSDNGGTVSNGIDTSATQTFQIAVTPVNDAPNFTVGSQQTAEEDSGANTIPNWVTGITAGPVDEAGQTLTFQIVNNSNPGLFSIAPSISPNGTLTYTTASNANGTAAITIQLMDGSGTQNNGQNTSGTQTFNIVITPVNDAPSFTLGADQTVLEDSGSHTVAGWAGSLLAGPVDESGQVLTFHVTAADPSLFSVQPAINPVTGDLTYTLADNANGTTSVSVTLSDDGGATGSNVDTSTVQTFNINITPVNDVPHFTVGADQTVLEDSGARTIAGWATAISPGQPDEFNQTLNFQVTAADPSLFSVQPAIDPITGNLTFTPALNANGSTLITVTLMDNGGIQDGGVNTSASQTFNISITAVNDAPIFSTGADQTALEDGGSQVIANWATGISAGATDESNQTLTFEVVATDPTLFSVQPAIDPVTGNLTFTPALNANGSTLVTVTLSDGGGTLNGGSDTSSSHTFLLHITPVNDAPSFVKGSDESVLEDAGPQVVLNWASALSTGPTDESGQELSFAVTAANPSLFSVQPSIDPVTGQLSYTPAANANGSTLITVTLQDNGGTLNGAANTSVAQTFNISITAVNDTPSFIVGSDSTVLEDAGAVSLNAWATGILSGPADEAGQVLAFTVTAADPSLFSVQPAIDPVTGTLTFTPAANKNGSTLVTVVLADNGGTASGGNDTSTTQTFNIVITGVNDAPSFTLPGSPDQTVNEDTGSQSVSSFATGLTTGPADEAGQSLAFQVSNDNNTLFSVQPTIDSVTGNLTYTLAENANGTAVVTVLLQDGGGTAGGGVDTSTAQTFIITVNAVNDAPIFTKGANQSVVEDAGPQSVTGWASNIFPGPAAVTNEFDQLVDFIVTNDNNALFSAQPAISANGKLTYQAAPNANGTATVTVKIHDDAGTAHGGVDTSSTQTFTITVVAQNDAPVANDATFSVSENATAGTVVGSVTATDVDAGDTKTYAIISGNSSGTFAINAATGQITVVNNALLDFETNPTLMLIVKVTDGSNAVGTANITINVTNIDDPLVLRLPSEMAVYVKRGGAVAIDPAASASDQDTPNIDFTGGTLRVTAVSVDNPDSHDRIGILAQGGGGGAGKILVKGSKIYYESTANQIGAIVGGSNGGPLVISLTSGATQTAVNALLKSVAFRNTSNSPKLGIRNISFELSNANSTESATASKLVRVVDGKEPPVVTLPGAAVNYTNQAAAVRIDPTATLTDPDSPNFNGGKLTVSITQGVNSNNRLSLVAGDGITVSGKDVLFNGQKIGRLTLGSNSLSISFNSTSATPAAAQALVRAIAFATASANTSLADRVIQLSLTDGDGGQSEVATKTIHVS